MINIIYITYFNNTIIYSKNKKDYYKYIKKTLRRLYNYNLYINLKKYKFYIIRILFLNYIVSLENISINPERVAVITN